MLNVDLLHGKNDQCLLWVTIRVVMANRDRRRSCFRTARDQIRNGFRGVEYPLYRGTPPGVMRRDCDRAEHISHQIPPRRSARDIGADWRCAR